MARALPVRLALCAALCALLGCGAAADGRCALDDGVALHQRIVRPRRAKDSAAAPDLTTPSKGTAAKVRPQIREVLDGLLKRTTAKLKLPTIPAVFRWELVGKATALAVDRYQRPKPQAAVELLDDVIGLAAEVLGSKDIATMEDAELAARLANVTRLHQMAQRYVEHAGAPPAVAKLVDAAAEAAQRKGALDSSTAAQLLVDAANQTSGPPVAELLAYAKRVSEGKEKFDAPRTLELEAAALTHLGAPPAIAEYYNSLADLDRRQEPADPVQEEVRAGRVLALAARQLGMPSAIPEILDLAMEVTPQSHILEKPAEAAKVLLRLNSLQAKLNDQLGGPAAVSELIQRLGAPLRNQTAPEAAEVLNLLAKASKQLSFPGAVAEFFEYLAPLSAKGSAPDPAQVQELLLQLSEQVGAPEALAKFGRDAAALAQKSGGQPDPAKLSKLVTQLIRKLGMPAFADIFGKIGGPLLTKGKAPDALALAAVAPSLMKVLPDMETAFGLFHDVRAKLLKPVMPVYETAVQKLTGNMPNSPMKLAFKGALSLARPPA